MPEVGGRASLVEQGSPATAGRRPPTPVRLGLLVLAFLLTTFSLTLFITGGFVTSIAGVRVSARSPTAAAIAAGMAIVIWFLAARRDTGREPRRANAIADDLAEIERAISRLAHGIIVLVAVLAGAVAVLFGTFSASGADASGYVSQAQILTQGRIMRTEPLAARADWVDAATTLAPLGWRPAIAPQSRALQVPTYAVGLPLLMAPLHALGGAIAAFLIVPLSFALAVWATGALAIRLAALGCPGPAAGIISAVWLATSPVALIEAMQPMSDVPVTAAWLLCWLMVVRSKSGPPLNSDGLSSHSERPGASRPSHVEGRRVLAAGFFAALAVLIRPNLAPLAAVPALYLILERRSSTEGPGLSRGIQGIIFSTPVALAGAVVAYLQWRWFGSPLRSGYGTAEDIYVLSNIAPNAMLYARWLLETHGPWLLASPFALWLPRRAAAGESGQRPSAARGEEQRLRDMRWLFAFAALVCAAYFVYAVFEVWTYLRFLLPALAVAMVAVGSLGAALIAKLPPAARALALVVVVLSMAAANVSSARDHDVFRVAARQSRALLAGPYLAAIIPSNGVIISGEQSGAMRYYTDRSIVRWDLATPDSLGAIGTRLASEGRDIWIALDDWEEEPFRRKFPATAMAALDWPPLVEAGSELRTRAWRVRDRQRFLRGDALTTDRLR